MRRTRLPLLVLAICAMMPLPSFSAEKKILVMVPKGEHPYYEPCYEGFRQAAAKHGVEAEIRTPQAFDLSQQVAIIQSLITRHVDGIAISALDDRGLVPVIQEATNAGIKVITFDSPAPLSAALCYIGTNNEKAGYEGAQALIKIMAGKGTVAVLQGGLDAPNLNLRFKGFERCIRENAPNIKIVAREDVDGKVEMASDKTEKLLDAHPDLTALFALSAEGAPGAAAVIRKRELAGKVILAGFDDLPETLAAIRDGVVGFCLAQRTYKMGQLALDKLFDAVTGKPLPNEIDTGVLIVTKDNVDFYVQRYQSIRRK
jgi:ribose transport system substrate-binding protein